MLTGNAEYGGLDLAAFVRRAASIPLWAAQFERAAPTICFKSATGGSPRRSTGRVIGDPEGRNLIQIEIGVGADRGDVALAVLHELSHLFGGRGHHRRWRTTFRTAALQVFGTRMAQSIPDVRGLDFRELEDRVATGIRGVWGDPPPPAYLVWKPAGVTATIPAPAALCEKWRRAVASGDPSPDRSPGRWR